MMNAEMRVDQMSLNATCVEANEAQQKHETLACLWSRDIKRDLVSVESILQGRKRTTIDIDTKVTIGVSTFYRLKGELQR